MNQIDYHIKSQSVIITIYIIKHLNITKIKYLLINMIYVLTFTKPIEMAAAVAQ